MKILKGLLLISIVLSLLVFVPGKAEAGTDSVDSNINTIGNGEYAITAYRIEITVHENNTFFIREYITAFFNVDKHGIYRKIPLRNEVIRLNGTKSVNRARITDIEVKGDLYTVFNEDGFRVIRIGDEDTTLTGSRDYVISYLYSIGRDPGRGYDEFYFNLIGYDWDTTISSIEFKVTMPKEFDKSMLGFSSGPQGSTGSGNISYEVNGNVITGSCNGVLNANEALTIRLELPDGYFVGADSNIDLMMILAIILPIVFAGMAFVLWFRFGRDETVIETVEFYPPEGFNSADIGFLYRGKAETIDVVSLLIYLANKGYITISETEEKSVFSKHKGFKITKVREYDGHDPNEKLFLDGLFKGTYEVTSNELKNNFYETLNEIVKNLNIKENREKLFEKSSLNKNIFVASMIAVVFALISLRPAIEYGGPELAVLAMIFPCIGFTIMLAGLIGAIKMPKWFALFFGGAFGGIPWAMAVLPALLMDRMYLLAYITGIICVFVMLFFAKYMSKRTAYGNAILGKIKGFKTFLVTAEKPRLEALVTQNPAYFYHILPFTYVLGVSDKWIKKFESISLESPGWYSGSSSFNSAAFGGFMNTTMTTASSAMSSSPSSSSGGGSSGGGSGGGGGGSW